MDGLTLPGGTSNPLDEMVLTSTHNLCFRAKIREIGLPLQTPNLLYNGGVFGDIVYTDMFS